MTATDNEIPVHRNALLASPMDWLTWIRQQPITVARRDKIEAMSA
jgi:hypothetical protein